MLTYDINNICMFYVKICIHFYMSIVPLFLLQLPRIEAISSETQSEEADSARRLLGIAKYLCTKGVPVVFVEEEGLAQFVERAVSPTLVGVGDM